MFRANKIQVCCTQGVTGGPELLHQFVDQLRKIGRDANIVYVPFDKPYECPEPYKIYDAPQSKLIDEPDVLVVVPEVSTAILRRLRKAEGAVWWLSVDNYFGFARDSLIKDAYRYVRRVVVDRRLPISHLRHFTHLAQSYYAAKFLERNNIKPQLLGDYLNEAYLRYTGGMVSEKKDIIAYNPKKGENITRKLRAVNPDLKFIAIKDMSRNQVVELLRTSKLYIDFGHHPGKDRLPREAAMAGCCVITGRRGSAANPYDIPIPENYKLDERSRNFYEVFRMLALSILKDYDKHYLNFEAYRAQICAEKDLFARQVTYLFGRDYTP